MSEVVGSDSVDTVPDPVAGTPVPSGGYGETSQISEADRALVKRIMQAINDDKRHHKDAFDQMREDMKVARTGRQKGWPEANYTANITGRHINQKVAALYAKNPKATARRRDTLDFAVWDETAESLQLAFQTVMQGQAQMQAEAAVQASMPPTVDQAGMMVPPPAPAPPPGFEEALAIIQDFQQGMQRREQIKKIGRTLEVLFSHGMREQQPVDFKTSMKKLVRRACTTGVGYVELQFQRQHGTDPAVAARIDDVTARLNHLKEVAVEAIEGEVDEDSAEMADLERSLVELEGRPPPVVKEGVVFDFPSSVKVIPDKLCTDIVGFVGCRRVTLWDLHPKQWVKETFGIDLGDGYTVYQANGDKDERATPAIIGHDEPRDRGLCCVYKHFDKVSGRVYYLCEGYEGFLKPPGPPDVTVEGFWPLYALTFNAVEDEDCVFPPSDVRLMLDMQAEYNISRQGKKEHRKAARPRMAAAKGALDEQSKADLSTAEPFTVTELNMDPQTSVDQVLQVIKIPGVDPNLYDTNEIFTDIQFVVGAQEASFGATSKSTATESSIAANATASATGSNVDDLDSFLTRVAQGAGQIMLREMSPEYVTRVVGPGAVWPQMSEQDLRDELVLEVEMGSTGKPNQAVEVANWERLLPSLLQMPNLNPTWLARETLRRLDDRMDLTEAVAANIPAIVAQNRMAQPMVDPASDPTQQGQEGGDKTATPQGQDGSQAPMGDNHAPSV